MKIAKKFRQLWKLDDGSGAFERVNSEGEGGTELLIVSPDGSLFEYVIVLSKEADQPKGNGPVYPSDLHAERQVEPAAAEPVYEPEPVSAPAPAPAPAPVPNSAPDPGHMTKDSALQIAKTVWGRGEGAVITRANLFPGPPMHSADKWLKWAVKQGWVIVDGDRDRITRGPVNPNPPAEVLSPMESRFRWGPDWVG